jgi:Dyp-type peroxidase family
VFRRLSQDVAGFRQFMSEAAREQGVSEELIGAKLVGRYKSGAPLELTGAQATDPGTADAALLTDAKINDFEYGDDPDGAVVPLGSHIRKTYPRDEPTDEGGEEDTQTHRILRRGIPFGASLPEQARAAEAGAAFPNDRGLLFLCYQTSIERQFEFIQRRWVNDPNFPKPGSGHDPVMSQVEKREPLAIPGTRTGHVALMQRFVTTTGGEYFFQPSVSALRHLAGAVPPVSGNPPPKPGPQQPPPRNGAGRPRP